MVTIPWHKRVLFLDDREALDTIRNKVAEAALANAGHPSMLGFFIDNEIPPDLVRWYGARRMEEFLNSLVRVVKKNDPLALAAYANFPPTEYLLPERGRFLQLQRLSPSQEGPRRLPRPPAKSRRRQAAHPVRIWHGYDPPSRGGTGGAFADGACHHGFRKRPRGHVHFFVDRRVVHRRRRCDRLGLRHRQDRPHAQGQLSAPCSRC